MENTGAGYDLIVVGAGPAGSACAITAARAGAKVLLLEKDRFPRHKVCGEFVSAESLRLLRDLLAGHALASEMFASSPEIHRGRIFLNQRVARLPIVPQARCIPRFDLDAALFQSARNAGAQAEDNIVARKVEQNGRFCVHADTGTFIAKAVVNSTGRWSQLMKHDVAGKAKWIGMKAHFREFGPEQSVDLYYFPGGYCGVTPVSQDTVNACAMVRADAAHSLEEVLARHPELWRRSRDWTQMFPSVTTSPLYFRKPATFAEGMMLAGDAAGFIDPFTGDGISLALQSGSLAADSLAGFLKAKHTLAHAHQMYRQSYFKRLAPAFAHSARLRRLLNGPEWIRGIFLALVGTRPVARWVVHKTRARTS